MKIEERKEILREALINSFIEEYKSYKNIVKIINKDLRKSKIDFKYSYNDFCIDFLNESLKNIEKIDIFSDKAQFNEFLINFYQFNLYILQTMLKNRLNNITYEAPEDI